MNNKKFREHVYFKIEGNAHCHKNVVTSIHTYLTSVMLVIIQMIHIDMVAHTAF